ncbi:hypothetical protein Q7A53_08495 [Halobacillus rhizosphaerae]|uniref:hypothetical protein n=1 Tax=Halobacillus rhizosphaerae TaxID=3064889 RepID=UPI00398BB37F
MEKKLKEMAKTSYVNELELSETQQRNMLKAIKSKGDSLKPSWKFHWFKNILGLVACCLVIIGLNFLDVDQEAVNNNSSSSSDIQEFNYEILSKAKGNLPNDMTIPTPFFKTIEQPYVKYQRNGRNIEDVSIKFRGEKNVLFVHISLGSSLKDIKADTKSKTDSYSYEDSTSLLLLREDNKPGIIYFEKGDYLYSFSLLPINRESNKKAVHYAKEHLTEIHQMAHQVITQTNDRS